MRQKLPCKHISSNSRKRGSHTKPSLGHIPFKELSLVFSLRWGACGGLRLGWDACLREHGVHRLQHLSPKTSKLDIEPEQLPMSWSRIPCMKIVYGHSTGYLK